MVPCRKRWTYAHSCGLRGPGKINGWDRGREPKPAEWHEIGRVPKFSAAVTPFFQSEIFERRCRLPAAAVRVTGDMADRGDDLLANNNGLGTGLGVLPVPSDCRALDGEALSVRRVSHFRTPHPSVCGWGAETVI